MTNARPDLGFGNELDDFDPAKWAAVPKRTVAAPHKAETRQIAEAAGFKSREAAATGLAPAVPATVRTERRRRTGRNAQFNLKARPETIETFCKIADEQGWGLGETLEKAVRLLEREYGGGSTQYPRD